MAKRKDSRTAVGQRSAIAQLNRRRFVQSAGAATVAFGFGMPSLYAQETPRVSEDDPTAQALNYVHDARSIDADKRPADRFCNNCALFGGGQDDEWASCSLFPGKNVAGGGWCSAWAPKQAG